MVHAKHSPFGKTVLVIEDLKLNLCIESDAFLVNESVSPLHDVAHGKTCPLNQIMFSILAWHLLV